MTRADGSSALPRFPVVAIVGVGLIGGSVAAALKANGNVERVLGVGRHRSSLAQAKALGLIDEILDLEHAVSQADLVILATPVGAIPGLLKMMAPKLGPQTIVTDVGSTKQAIVAQASECLQEKVAQFVPGHPIAGAEQTGPEAAQASLFQHRHVILTPHPQSTLSAVEAVTILWEQCGARVLTMAPEEHDQVLASVSHLPHLLSSAYMWQVAAADDADQRLSIAGTGFRDITRLAAGSPEMWHDIFLANQAAVLTELRALREVLATFEELLASEDSAGILEFLERAALARRFWGSRTRQ